MEAGTYENQMRTELVLITILSQKPKHVPKRFLHEVVAGKPSFTVKMARSGIRIPYHLATIHALHRINATRP